MYCSRLDHFVKIETGTKPMFRCCHMVSPPKFNSLLEIEQSAWLKSVKEQLEQDQWPDECIRCKQSEEVGLDSIRIISNNNHSLFKEIKEDYIIVDVVADTICNAACPICSEDLSSTIAKLKGIPINQFNGEKYLNQIANERILQIDLLGGEPGASRRTKNILNNLADYPNLQTVHLSTNGSVKIRQLETVLEKGIKVELVISMDGTGSVFEYARFPIKWKTFLSTIKYYKDLRKKYSNLSLLLWSSISALCVADLDSMIKFSELEGIPLNGSAIEFPSVLSIRNKNFITDRAKDKLAQVDNDFIQKILKSMVLTNEDNSPALVDFLTENDSIRKTNFRSVYHD